VLVDRRISNTISGINVILTNFHLRWLIFSTS